MSRPESEPQKIAINRPLVGMISLACLSAAGVLFVTHGAVGEMDVWRGALMRSGLLMGAFWFALPTKSRDAAWANVSLPMLFGIFALIIAVPSRPRVYVPLLAVLAVVGYLLRARRKPGSEGSRPKRDSWQK